MKYLLDTHTLLWFLAGDASLSGTARQHVENEANSIFVSMAGLWKIAIKSSLVKLELSVSLEALLIRSRAGFTRGCLVDPACYLQRANFKRSIWRKNVQRRRHDHVPEPCT